MQKNSKLKIICLACLALFIGASIVITPASALLSQNVMSWYTTSDTNASSEAVGDVNADGLNEIVTAGWFNDGTRWNAQVIVRNSATSAIISQFQWYSIQDTQIASVAIGDVNNDGIVDVVTGGSFFDGTRWRAHIVIFDVVNGALTVVSQYAWYWLGNTRIASIAIGDVNNDNIKEIVTAGTFNDGTRQWAQMIVWNVNGVTFTPTSQFAWYWISDTLLNSVAIGNVDATAVNEIVTGGTRFDGTRWVSHLVVFGLTGSTLNVLNQMVWYWISNTEVNSIAIGDVNADGSNEVVTGGSRFDGTRWNAQLIVFNGANLNVLNQYVWYFTSDTRINSVAIGSFAATSGLDILTAGKYNDGTRDNAMVLDWYNIASGFNQNANWFTTSNTQVNQAAIANLGAGNKIVVTGSFYDLTRSNAQLSVWS
jgi:hypothetical protein